MTIRIPMYLDATPAMGMVDKVVGGLKKLTGTIGKTGVAFAAAGVAVGIFAAVKIRQGIKEVRSFEQSMVELNKVLGRQQAFPIGEELAKLSTQMPIARDELIGIAAQAARLGVRGTGNIVEFTKVMAMMGVATETTAEEAAEALARIAKQTNLPISKLRNLASVINELSNNFATTSSEIIEAMRRSAPTLAQLGLQAEEIAAVSASLITVSEGAARAGTRLKRLGQELFKTDKIEKFAEAFGRSTESFRQWVAQDPVDFFVKVAELMATGSEEAINLATAMDSRVQAALMAMGRIPEDQRRAFQMARQEMKDATGIVKEYDRAIETANSKLTLIENTQKEINRQIGLRTLPFYKKWLDLYQLIVKQALKLWKISPVEGLFSEEATEVITRQTRAIADNTAKLETFWGQFQRRWRWSFEHPFTTEFDKMQTRDIYTRLEERLREATFQVSAFTEEFLGLVMAQTTAEMTEEDFNKVIDDTLEIVKKFPDVLLDNAKAVVEFSNLLANMYRPMQMLFQGPPVGGTTLFGFMTQDLTDFDEKFKEFMEKWQAWIDRPEGVDVMLGGIEDLTEEFERMTAQIGLEGFEKFMQSEEVINILEEIRAAETEGRLEDLRRLQGAYDRLVGTARVHYDALELHERKLESIAYWEEQRVKKAERLNDDWQIFNDTLDDMKLERIKVEFGEADEHIAKLRLNMEKITSPEMRRALGVIIEAHREWHEVVDPLVEKQKQLEELQSRMQRRLERVDMANLMTQFDMISNVADEMAGSILDSLDDLIEGTKGFGQALMETVRDIVREFIQFQLSNRLIMLLANLIGLPIQATAVSNLAAPNTTWSPGMGSHGWLQNLGMQHGGRVEANRLALVGERGPELFVPNVSGRIVPNHQVASENSVVVYNQFTIHAMDSQDVKRALAAESDFIHALTVSSFDRNRSTVRRAT